MSRRGGYTKNSSTSTSSRLADRIGTRPLHSYADVAKGQNGQGHGGGGHPRQHDHRSFTRSSRGMRGVRNGRGYRGRNQRSFDSRNNNHSLSQVSREEETYKVTIPLSDAYDTQYLMNLLKENLDDPNIIFYNFQRVQNSNVFYVVGADHAETLRNLSRRITTHTNQRLVILTSKAPLPCAHVDDRVEAAIKVAMSSLYDSTSRVMNLADFRQAEEFKRQGLYVTIGKANVMRTVVQIIAENTPDLVALNLRENKMNFLEQLRPLGERCRSLRAIDLSKNKIHSFSEINNLRELDLVELVLEGNPFIDDFPTHAVYIKAVRKLFKNLTKLDNEDLPAEIGFDLGVVESLSETKGSCIPPANSAFIYQFLEAYYKIYDTENRQGLIQAYHQNATFSFSFSKHEGGGGGGSSSLQRDNNSSMAGYYDSHNLLRLKDESFWVKFVKTSSVDIVAFLCKLPNTEHDPDSFKVDVPFCEGTTVTVVVTGTFKETFKAGRPGRSFVRTFFLTPHGNGFAIINEMFVVSNLSTKQVMEAKQQQQQSNSSTTASTSSGGNRRNVNANVDNLMIDVEFNRPSTSSALNSFGAVGAVASMQPPPQLQPPLTPSLLQHQQQQQPLPTITSPPGLLPAGAGVLPPVASPQLAAPAGDAAAAVGAPQQLTTEMELIVLKFMEVTKMNREYTLKCLHENGFNGDAAYAVFQKLHSLNIIPPEAFIN